MKKEMTSNKKF